MSLKNRKGYISFFNAAFFFLSKVTKTYVKLSQQAKGLHGSCLNKKKKNKKSKIVSN